MIRAYLVGVGRFVTALAAAFGNLIESLASRGLRYTETWLTGTKHAKYGLAVTRILLGLTGVGLLLTNLRTRLYTFGAGSAWNGEAAHPTSEFPRMWIFSLFHRLALHDTWFTLAYVGLLILACLVVLGWRMKIVLPVYFFCWVGFAEMNDLVGDQGDNMYRITIMTLLFADTAQRWSLDARRAAIAVTRDSAPGGVLGHLRRAWLGGRLLPEWLTNTTHNLALVVITCHVCFVYASGALYKASGAPWQQGYAIYNPLHVIRFSPWPELADLLTQWAPLVALVSWASIILQMSFPMMLTNRVTRVLALFGILGFHLGIAVLMGLPWFSLAMIAVDSIFIRDVTWRAVSAFLGEAWQASRVPLPTKAPHEDFKRRRAVVSRRS